MLSNHAFARFGVCQRDFSSGRIRVPEPKRSEGWPVLFNSNKLLPQRNAKIAEIRTYVVFSLRSMRSFAANSSSLAAGRVASWRLCDFALKRFVYPCARWNPWFSPFGCGSVTLRPLRLCAPHSLGTALIAAGLSVLSVFSCSKQSFPSAADSRCGFLGVLCAPACIICGQKYAQVANTTELTYGIIYLRFSVDNSSLSSILDGLW